MQLETVKNGITVYPSTTEDGFKLNDRLWTRLSPDYMNWKTSNEFCHDRNTLLGTLDDQVEFRHDTKGADDSHLSQWARTLIGLVPDGKAGDRAYIFEPNEDALRHMLALPAIAPNQSYLLLDIKDDLAKSIKRFASNTDRTFIVPQEDLKLGIHLDAKNQTEYGTNEIVRDLMPRHAEQNAAYILANQDKVDPQYRGFGHVWFARPDLKKGQMFVRPVCLGGNDYGNINFVIAFDIFIINWRARGVASVQKISP